MFPHVSVPQAWLPNKRRKKDINPFTDYEIIPMSQTDPTESNLFKITVITRKVQPKGEKFKHFH